jgi:hypothetical protein
MGNPIFRFTLSHEGSGAEPLAIPAFAEWSTRVGSDEEWIEGSSPYVDLPGTGPFTDADSEYLYIDYGFILDNVYSITLNYLKEYNSGSSNPRTIELAVLDSGYNVVFSQTESTPISPGGSGSVTLDFTATSSCVKLAVKAGDGSDVRITLQSLSSTQTNPDDLSSSIVITEPGGWLEAKLKLERHEKFNSLIEYFQGSFLYYGDNGVDNGGIHYIKEIERVYGVDATVEELIEISFDNGLSFEEIFEGQLDISQLTELFNNTAEVPTIPDDFWSKFISRKATPVDLQATSNLDGVAITPIDDVRLLLPSQIVLYNSHYNWVDSVTYPGEAFFSGLQLDWEEVILDDIRKFTLPREQINIGAIGGQAVDLVGLIEAPYDGDYTFDIRLEYARYDSGPGLWVVDSVLFYIQRPDQIAQTASFTNSSASYGSDAVGIATYNGTISLRKGEQLAIYGDRTNATETQTIFGTRRLQWLANADLATTIAITLSGEQIIDGVMTSASRVLVKNQGDPIENGVYVTGAGAWTRATDADSSIELISSAIYVTAGDTHIDSAWRMIDESFSIGVSANRWEFMVASDERFKAYPGTDVDNHLIIAANTRYKSTESRGFLLHDAGAAILKSYGLENENPFYSEFLGGLLTNSREYEEDGCAWNYAVLKGLQIRGYTLDEKPFFWSFDEWWDGVNPILNLGLEIDFIPGSIVTPISSTIEDLFSWEDATGDFPGAWNYAVYGLPFTSVNGDGGVEGYTCGLWATTAGVTYAITTVVEIFETGVNPVDITFIWAILDAGFNEIATQEFTYNSDGFHHEVFSMTPATNGVYFAVRVRNDTVSDTKSLVIALAIGDETTQLLSNPGFDTGASWTNEGAGTSWSIASSEASVTLVTGSSTAFTQEFVNDRVGTYYWVGEYTPTGIGGGESLGLTCNFYDEDDNLIATETTPLSDDSTDPWAFDFVSAVPITKVEMVAEVTAGTNISIVVRYAALHVVTTPEPIVVDDERVIRVEEREYFYDPDPVVYLSNVLSITRQYDENLLWNKIKIGYTQWQSEDISGIDDPQTVRTYATRFKKVGKELQLMSSLIAASIAFETTRRTTLLESTDYKYDNNVFILSIKNEEVSPDAYSPEFDENFSEINNLSNSDGRYNIALTPARNLLRWRNVLNGCLQSYITSYYKFVGGEGNYDMSSQMSVAAGGTPDNNCENDSFEGELLSEKQDIPVTTDYIHLPLIYTIEHYLSWEDYKRIRTYKRKAIGISQTESDYKAFFIKELEYGICDSRVTIKAWPIVFFEISQPDFTPAITSPAESVIPYNALLDIDGNPILDANGDYILIDL